MEITIKDFWTTLKKSAILMIVCAILFGSVFYVYNSFFATKRYSSSAGYILLPKSDTVKDVEELNNYMVVGGKSVTTLESVLMSENTMQAVLDYIRDVSSADLGAGFDWDYVLDGEYTARQLLNSVSFVSSDNSANLMFTVSCRAATPKDSRVLLEAFGKCINEQSEQVLQGIFIIKEIHAPKDGVKISPSVTRNTLLGVILGAVLPYIAVFVIGILDTRIKEEKDLKEKFKEHPVLGQIPYIG